MQNTGGVRVRVHDVHPDKKLRWFSHLGSIHLDIQLHRTVSAEVPPLEAAFIELFSERGIVPHLVNLRRQIWLTLLRLLQTSGP